MINVDETTMMHELLTISEAEQKRIINTMDSNRGFEKLDRIEISDSELEKLVGALAKSDEATYDLMLFPSIPEFELSVKIEESPDTMTIVRFVKTVITESKIVQDGVNGSRLTHTPAIEIYISFQSESYSDIAAEIFTVSGISGSTGKRITGTSGQVIAVSSRMSYSMKASNYSFEDLSSSVRNLKLVYLAIQRAFRNRPELFYTKSREARKAPQKSSHKSVTKKNKVRVAKVICLNPDELVQYAKIEKHISCPCWGVSGHMRTYKKSGKQIWIAPYRKGKERNNPEVYEHKEYTLVS